MNYSISLFLDTRRAKQTGKFPLKLRVFTSKPRIQRLFPLPYEFTKQEFQSTWLTERTRGEFKEIRYELEAIEAKAKNVASKIKPFNFNSFEKKYFQENTSSMDIYSYLDAAAKTHFNKGSISTSELYLQTVSSLKAFQEYCKTNSNSLLFSEVTPDWLQGYENYRVVFLDRSITTVGIYLRNLRAIFNQAIRDKEITSDIYPFGKSKYRIPAGKNTKKALNMDSIKVLFNVDCVTPEQAEAKDFWFFSYLCNGINVKDIVNLKYKDIEGDILTFYRAKTRNTAKEKRLPIKCYLADFTKGIIEKYGTSTGTKNDFIFPIINSSMTEAEKHRVIKNFTRKINQHMETIALNANLPNKITTYWARHSYATNMIRNKASMEQVMKALGHKSLNTTENYFAGFEDAEVKELTHKLINF